MDDLFSDIEGEARRVAEIARGVSIFPPFPTRNDFSGKPQGLGNADFPTFPTFPTVQNGFAEIGLDFAHDDPADLSHARVYSSEDTGARRGHARNGGKVGNPIISIKESGKSGKSGKLLPIGDNVAAFHERAGILEYDEGLPRLDAERLAAEQLGLEFADLKSVTVSVLPSPPLLHSPGWLPEPSPGVRILAAAAVEVDPAEYDKHADALMAELPDVSAERNRLAFAKCKGWVLPRGGERVFVRGRM